MRHVDENNLSHHFLEEVAHTQGPLGSQGPGGGHSSWATTSQGTLRMSFNFVDSSLQSDPKALLRPVLLEFRNVQKGLSKLLSLLLTVCSKPKEPCS